MDSTNFFSQPSSSRSGIKTRWPEFESSLIHNLERIWICVQSILCDDAPEGNFPGDLDGAHQIDTKDALSYSWRALKESRYGRTATLFKLSQLTCTAHS